MTRKRGSVGDLTWAFTLLIRMFSKKDRSGINMCADALRKIEYHKNKETQLLISRMVFLIGNKLESDYYGEAICCFLKNVDPDFLKDFFLEAQSQTLSRMTLHCDLKDLAKIVRRIKENDLLEIFRRCSNYEIRVIIHLKEEYPK